jgi:hypothetical protein
MINRLPVLLLYTIIGRRQYLAGYLKYYCNLTS